MKNSVFSISLIAALVVIGISGFWSFEKYSELRAVVSETEAFTASAQTMESQGKIDSEGALEEAKQAQQNAEQSAEIKKILPPAAFKTDLLRDLEKFFESMNSTKNPMLVNSINIPDPLEDTELSASVITVNLSIESTESNFYKFMEWVETSGYVNPEGTTSGNDTPRLMSIESIQIQFPEALAEETAATAEVPEVKTLNYNVTLNTYIKSQDV